MEIETASTRVIYDTIHDPIDIWNDSEGCSEFRARARSVLYNDNGECEHKDYLSFNVFALSEANVKQKLADFFQKLTDDASRLDVEMELVDIIVASKP